MFSFLRVIKFAFQNMGRNLGLAFMTVLVLVLMLLSVNVLWSVKILTQEAVKLVKDQINVSLYFVPEAKDKEIQEIVGYIKSFPEVTTTTLLSREDVLASFRERHKMSKEVLSALEELGANPFGPTLIVKTREPSDYKKVIQALSVPEYESLIEAKSFDQNEDAIERLQNITNRLEQTVLGLVALFAIISFLIIFNTVRVGIYTQRAEIGIKRLVGASNWFIRGPYLVESLFYTLLSMAVTVGLVYLGLRWLDPYLNIVFTGGLSLTNYYNLHILYVFGSQALAVLFLTVVSSTLAMRRQLKV